MHICDRRLGSTVSGAVVVDSSAVEDAACGRDGDLLDMVRLSEFERLEEAVDIKYPTFNATEPR
jgi:hypothetical protein